LTSIDNLPYTPDEFYFSNSHDYPEPVISISNSINPDGTIINVADVSLQPVPAVQPGPEPASVSLMLAGLTGLLPLRRRRRRGTR
jgi:hypothetical protein